MKTPTPKIRELLGKLERLAERGINGERDVARKKLARLKRRYDFSAPDVTSTADLFAGVFYPATAALSVCRFDAAQCDIANAIKWAIEQNTGIRCLFKGEELYAEAMPDTAANLGAIAATVTENFGELWKRFAGATNCNPLDRRIFVRGLFDGMQGEARAAGEMLPARAKVERVTKGRGKHGLSAAPGLGVHPYTAALDLGKQIRFAVPLEQLTAELERSIKGELAA